MSFLRNFGLVLVFGCYCASGLQLNDKDFSDIPRCTPLENDPSLNVTWLMSIDTWSNSIWNKYDLLKVLKISMGDTAFAKLDDSALPNSCFYYTGIPSGDKLEVIFMNRRLRGWQPAMSQFEEGVHEWVFKRRFYATNYKVFTDNKSFYLGINRWVDGTLGYYVASPAGVTISPEDLERIYQKIESFGFSRKSAFFLKQDCPEDFKTAKVAFNRGHRY